MLLQFCALFLGLGGLVYGANLLVDGAMGLASNYKWPTLWVGTVLVGFATTLPEMIVSLLAVLQGHPHISLGNALGSYIANIGMVLGVTAMIQPLTINASLLRREMPLLTISVTLLLILLSDFKLSVQDGLVLIFALVGFFWLLSKNSSIMPTIDLPISKKKSYWLFVLGALILWFAGDVMVSAAAKIARYLNMSEWTIGLTVVAVGTSLPELSASLVSARRGHHDLAIGNVIGSNILGLLGVVAIPSILAPGTVPKTVISYDISAMAIVTVGLWLVSIKKRGRLAEITRVEGLLLLLLFLCYLLLAFMHRSML